METLALALVPIDHDLQHCRHSLRVAWAAAMREVLRLHEVLTIEYTMPNGQVMPITVTPEECAVLFAKWGI